MAALLAGKRAAYTPVQRRVPAQPKLEVEESLLLRFLVLAAYRIF
jgi:hypothetical protein